MKLYRDIQSGEELQIGDMWRLANDSDAEWQTITADDIAEAPEGGRTVTSVEESGDRKSTRLNSSHIPLSRMPSSA